MTYYLFDILGRFAGESDTETERCTDAKPDKLTSEYNWNGIKWVYAPNVMISPVTGIASQPDNEEKQTNNDFRNLLTMREKKLMKGSVEDQIKSLKIGRKL